MITWKDIKYTTLQKMFSITGSSTVIPNDSATMEYVNAMPAAFNEALNLLSTAGKFIIKEYQYVNYPAQNCLGEDTFKTYTIISDSVEFKASDAKSYYFKLQGKPVSCKLYCGETEVIDFYPEPDPTDEEYVAPDYNSFLVFKGNIPFPEVEEPQEGEEPVDVTPRLVIEANSPVNLMNPCFYPCTYMDDASVPPYERYIRIKLSDVLDDFYQLAPAELYSLGYDGQDYIVADDYYQEVDKTLVIQRSKPGIYIIHYRAYPKPLDLNTPDDTELPLDPEVATIIPLYMASELYKDDDNAIATTYRNEAEVAREALSNGPMIPKREKFITKSRWA